jgi:hypothetical protein
MIPVGVDKFVGIEPVDLRWGFDRLAGRVTERMGRAGPVRQRWKLESWPGRKHWGSGRPAFIDRRSRRD